MRDTLWVDTGASTSTLPSRSSWNSGSRQVLYCSARRAIARQKLGYSR